MLAFIRKLSGMCNVSRRSFAMGLLLISVLLAFVQDNEGVEPGKVGDKTEAGLDDDVNLKPAVNITTQELADNVTSTNYTSTEESRGVKQVVDPTQVPGNVTEEAEAGTVQEETTVPTEAPTTTAPPTPLHTLEELESIEGPWACSSRVFCQGPLLDAVQRNRLFPDSKTFVDMSLKEEPDKVIKAFEELVTEKGKENITRTDLIQFVDRYFEDAGHELEAWTPADWTDTPGLVEKIKDEDYKEWASELNGLWKTLARRIKSEVFNQSDRYSIIPVPNGFIIPGDRFREYYYWDTYWIINGLLLSDMVNTTRGIIENLLHVVDKFGFVPNGGRIYYTQRSQPPLLTSMVDAYYEASNDDEFIKNNFLLLDKEYHFWIKERTVDIEKDGNTYSLAQYNVNLTHPRPEGYLEDLETVRGMPLNVSASKFRMLASGAESGWDYSTRWFSSSDKEDLTLDSIKTTDIIPADLNTFLYYTEQLLAKFSKIAGLDAKEKYYASQAETRQAAIEAVLWSEKDGIWYDYDLQEKAHHDRFYLSNIAPLLIYPDNVEKAKKVVQYLKTEKVLDFPGGLPTSKLDSGQQWDFPNTWAPIVYLVSTSLANSNCSEAQEVAFEISKTWLESAYKAWSKTNKMFEKYQVTQAGAAGHGGEYSVQVGFGWTNGYVLQLLDRYSDVLEAPTLDGYVINFWRHTGDQKLMFILIPVAIFIAAVLMFIFLMKRTNKRRVKASRTKQAYSSANFQKVA